MNPYVDLDFVIEVQLVVDEVICFVFAAVERTEQGCCHSLTPHIYTAFSKTLSVSTKHCKTQNSLKELLQIQLH